MTEIIAQNLYERGHEVILLSKSWCDVSDNNFFGTVEELSVNKPFYKRYFIDPIQVKASRLDILSAYTGLGCKAIEYESVEQILFAEELKYSLMIELLKERYQIPCYFLLYENSLLRCMSDDYIIPILHRNLMVYDAIYTYSEYKNFLISELHINEKRIFDTEPVHVLDLSYIAVKKELSIYVFSAAYTAEMRRDIIKKLTQRFGVDAYQIFFVWTEKSATDEMGNCLIDIRKIPTNAIVLWENEMMNYSNVNYNSIIAACASGFIPLINREHLNRLRKYKVNYFQVGELYAIFYLRLSDKAIDEYFALENE